MHIKPYLGEEIGRGKSGFAVNRGAVNRGFTVLLFPTSVLNILVVSRVVYVVTQVVRFTVQYLRVKTVDHIPDQFTDQIPDRS